MGPRHGAAGKAYLIHFTAFILPRSVCTSPNDTLSTTPTASRGWRRLGTSRPQSAGKDERRYANDATTQVPISITTP